MEPTVSDVARKAGVSATTVSLCFQPRSRICERTRRRVLAAAAALNYFPNLAARTLRKGESKTVGFLVNDLTNPFYGRMVSTAQKIAIAHGFELFVADSQWDPVRERSVMEQMLWARVRGILVCLCERDPANIEFLQQSRRPFIMLDTIQEAYTGAFVINDLRRAGVLAAEHLLSIGCRHPVMASVQPELRSFSSFQNIEAGFHSALATSGVVQSPVASAGLDIAAGRAAFVKLREDAPEVDGVFCVNDLCALGMMEAADELGVRVGEDIAIMGIDDLDVSALRRISLTSIRQPCERLASLAAEALFRMLDGTERELPQLRLEPELVARGSTQREGANPKIEARNPKMRTKLT